MPLSYNRNSRFLFVGDGITDGGRSKDPQNLGFGFVRMIHDYLLARHSTTAPHILNHGETNLSLSGWLAKWPVDALRAQPDLVCVFLDVPEPAGDASSEAHERSLDECRAVYRQLLVQTKQLAPRTRLMLCEPAALWSNIPVEADDRLRPYVHSLFRIGEEFKAHGIVPFHSALVHARRSRPDVSWLGSDGQLTSAGHAVLAYTWLEEAGLTPLAMS